jgi:hypothetical protein
MSNEWVMVPREPTESMFSASSFQEWDTFEQEWRAMLDAAPAAPVQQAEPLWARPDQLRQVPFLCALYKTQAAPDLVPLYRHPPPAEVQRLREAAYNAIEAFDQGAHGADEIDALRRALEGGE